MAEEAKKKQKRDYIYALGRRKAATARVRLYSSVKEGLVWGEQPITKEQILVNGEPVEHYFPGPLFKAMYTKPFEITNTLNKYAVTVKVDGGGRAGQLDAMIFGIARALSSADPVKYRSLLKTQGMLARDARVRERRKVGTGGKARHKKQSPKR